MANKKHSRRRERFRWWFSRKKKKADPFDSGAGITGSTTITSPFLFSEVFILPSSRVDYSLVSVEDDAVEEDAGFCGWSMEMDPRISTHELR